MQTRGLKMFAAAGSLIVTAGALAQGVEREIDPRDAIADFTQAIALRPHHSGTWMGRGTARAALRRYAKAERDYDEGIRLAPSRPTSYFNRALTRAARGNIKGAVEDVDACLRNAPPAWPHRARVQAYRAQLLRGR